MSGGVTVQSLAQANYNARIEVACIAMQAHRAEEEKSEPGRARARTQPAGPMIAELSPAGGRRKVSALAAKDADSVHGPGTTGTRSASEQHK